MPGEICCYICFFFVVEEAFIFSNRLCWSEPRAGTMRFKYSMQGSYPSFYQPVRQILQPGRSSALQQLLWEWIWCCLFLSWARYICRSRSCRLAAALCCRKEIRPFCHLLLSPGKQGPCRGYGYGSCPTWRWKPTGRCGEPSELVATIRSSSL